MNNWEKRGRSNWGVIDPPLTLVRYINDIFEKSSTRKSIHENPILSWEGWKGLEGWAKETVIIHMQ